RSGLPRRDSRALFVSAVFVVVAERHADHLADAGTRPTLGDVDGIAPHGDARRVDQVRDDQAGPRAVAVEPDQRAALIVGQQRVPGDLEHEQTSVARKGDVDHVRKAVGEDLRRMAGHYAVDARTADWK